MEITKEEKNAFDLLIKKAWEFVKENTHPTDLPEKEKGIKNLLKNMKKIQKNILYLQYMIGDLKMDITIGCVVCGKTRKVNKIEWDEGKIFTCEVCLGERFRRNMNIDDDVLIVGNRKQRLKALNLATEYIMGTSQQNVTEFLNSGKLDIEKWY